jgi:ketosteroid isomerase-like protein
MMDHRDDEAQIRQLEHERFAAVVDGDWDLFASHCHPDLTYVHTNAVVDTRDSYLARCRSGHYEYRSIEHPIRHIRVLDHIALVFGEMRSDMKAGGVDKTLDNVTLAVWARYERTWKLLAYHPTAKPIQS